ncbi:hypothetical protein ABPG73_017027 [Tetrahymena malaccensis]
MSVNHINIHLKKLQNSYITICLKVSKPNFVLNEFITFKEDNKNNGLITENQLVYLKVFDQALQKSKMLIICLAKEFLKYKNFYLEVTEKSTKKEITLNMIDDYYLDLDQIFYVFEMECFDSTLDYLKQKFNLPNQIISNTKYQIQDFFKNNLHIFYQEKQQCNQVYYICMNDQNNFNIKINLIDPNWKIQLYLEDNSDLITSSSNPQQYIEQNQNMNQEIKLENLVILEQNYQAQDILQMISQFSDYLKTQIEKKDLLLAIQNNHTDMLNFHPLEIFKVLEEHPQYETFQIQNYDKSSFELKVTKRSQIVTLNGIKHNTLSSAEKMLSQYQFVIQNIGLQQNSTILSAELVMIENYFYILTEKSFIEYVSKHKNSMINSNEYIVLYAFLHFSHQILIQNDFQITRVNPKNLLFNKNQNQSQHIDSHIYKLRKTYEIYQQKKPLQFKQEMIYKDMKNKFQSKLVKLSEFNTQLQDFMVQNNLFKQQNQLSNIIQDEFLQQPENISGQSNVVEQQQNNYDDNLIIKKYLIKEKIMSFQIDEISTYPDQYLSKYIEIVNQSISKHYCSKGYMMITVQNNKLVELFFQKISENNKEEATQIFNQLLVGFDILQTISNNESRFDLIQISSTDFRKIKIQITEKYQIQYLIELLYLNKQIQIVSLRMPVNLFSQYCHFQNGTFNKVSNKKLVDLNNTSYQQQIQQLEQFLLSNDNQKMQECQMKVDLPNLNSFYKLKRLVSITLKEDFLEDTRENFEKYSETDNFYENLLNQNRSF